MAAVESQLKLHKQKQTHVTRCDRLSLKSRNCLPHPPSTHLYDFETYKHNNHESATSKLVHPLSALSDESRVYNLSNKQIRVRKTRDDLKLPNMSFKDATSAGVQHPVLRISRLDMMFSA